MKGKLIVVEGTDCSGKETQTKLLMDYLNEKGYKTVRYSFPNYETATGKIIAGPYLGKEAFGDSWFLEGAPNVLPKVASLYYAADRLYNIDYINDQIDKGVNVILDRYVYSNMGHQGGKIEDDGERNKMYEWIHKLEFEMLNLPIPSIRIFLHLPYELSLCLRENRLEGADEHERDEQHLMSAEKSYIEIATKYEFKTIECFENEKIKTIATINDELVAYVVKQII